MNKLLKLVSVSLLAIALSACATTETDPSKVGIWDLTGGKQRLDDYLENRRAELSSLQQSSAGLQKRLDVQKTQLQKMRTELKPSKTAPSSKRNEKLYNQVSAKQVELDAARAKLNKISKNIVSYDEKLSSGKISNKNEAVLRVAEYQTDLEYQAKEVEKLERDINKLNSQS